MRESRHAGQGNDLGYGKSVQDVTMGNPQPSALTGYAEGEGSETKWWSVLGVGGTSPQPSA